MLIFLFFSIPKKLKFDCMLTTQDASNQKLASYTLSKQNSCISGVISELSGICFPHRGQATPTLPEMMHTKSRGMLFHPRSTIHLVCAGEPSPCTIYLTCRRSRHGLPCPYLSASQGCFFQPPPSPCGHSYPHLREEVQSGPRNLSARPAFVRSNNMCLTA